MGFGILFAGLINMTSAVEPLTESEEFIVMIQKFSENPLLAIVIGLVVTVIVQSSSATVGMIQAISVTGTMTFSLVYPLIMGINLGTCVTTAMLCSIGSSKDAKRTAIVHILFNTIGTIIFTAIIWIFKDPIVNLLISVFPGEDPMSLQMRVSLFHVIFNVTTTLCLLPFVKQLVKYSCMVIKDKKEISETLSLKYVDDRLITTPPVALMQVKKEINYMMSLVEENIKLSFAAMDTGSVKYGDEIAKNEVIIDFTNSELTKYLIKLSANVEASDEKQIGSYFHVLNDLERIGDHAENFHEIGVEMLNKNITFTDQARTGINNMRDTVISMFGISKDAFENSHKDELSGLTELEQNVDNMKRELIADHFNRLAEGNCSVEVSPYYSSVVVGLERVADHLVNVGYSIVNPTGSQKN